jgi:protein-ribulosamine 3-kinase
MGSTDAVKALLESTLHTCVKSGFEKRIDGGFTDSSAQVATEHGPIFVKYGAPTLFARFHAEVAGLKLLTQSQAVRVPQVLGNACDDSCAFIALEWIDFRQNTRSSEALLGERLAWQHRVLDSNFGLEFDNSIGANPQRNTWCADWIEFFREHRLRAQLKLAKQHDASAEMLDRGALLCEVMDALFGSYSPMPSLLHGDLWGGNWGTDRSDMPVIFDPAVYFGDREADIAMTKLFGGFGPAFYTAYHSTWPLDQAAGTRTPLYNLYHVLNHFNLFGGAYESKALSMMNRLLAELGH